MGAKARVGDTGGTAAIIAPPVKAYRRFRLKVTARRGGKAGSNVVHFAELKVFGTFSNPIKLPTKGMLVAMVGIAVIIAVCLNWFGPWSPPGAGGFFASVVAFFVLVLATGLTLASKWPIAAVFADLVVALYIPLALHRSIAGGHVFKNRLNPVVVLVLAVLLQVAALVILGQSDVMAYVPGAVSLAVMLVGVGMYVNKNGIPDGDDEDDEDYDKEDSEGDEAAVCCSCLKRSSASAVSAEAEAGSTGNMGGNTGGYTAKKAKTAKASPPKKGPRPSSLPRGWQKSVDCESGRTYYHNEQDETQWDHPGRPDVEMQANPVHRKLHKTKSARPTTEAEWYYCDEDNAPQGPYSARQLMGWLGEGRLAPDTLVAEDGSADWVEMEDTPLGAGLTTQPNKPTAIRRAHSTLAPSKPTGAAPIFSHGRPTSAKAVQAKKADRTTARPVSKRCELDQDIQDKAAGKYSEGLEGSMQRWVEACTGEAFDPEMTFAENLKDGTRLCNVLNAFVEGAVKRVKHSTMPFKQMELISQFLDKSRKLVHVDSRELFCTPDLFEEKVRRRRLGG